MRAVMRNGQHTSVTANSFLHSRRAVIAALLMAVACVTTLTSSHTLAAIYTYEGASYTNTEGPVYDDSMAVSGFFVTREPLPQSCPP